MAVMHPSKEEFENIVKENSLIVVDFFATWCGPCKMFGPILEEASTMYENDVKFIKIDIDENDELAMEYDIQAVPTVVYLKNGQEIQRTTGIVSLEELKQVIEDNK